MYPIGAVSRGSKGELLADIAELRKAGCVAITDDGHPVRTALLLRRALEYAGMFGMPVIEHCEDPSLKGDGVAHEGYYAASLGLRGMPGACEALGVERGVLLVGADRLGLSRRAHERARIAARGAQGQGSGHSRDVRSRAASLHADRRSAGHAHCLRHQHQDESAAARGRGSRRDARRDRATAPSMSIATDHAPHHYDEKKVEFDRAPFGIVGLETAVSLSLDRLVHAGRIRLSRLVELLSVNPARILKVPGGTLSEGAPADITIIAPDLKVRIEAAKLRSRSKNTPFDGWELRGGVAATLVGGRPLYVNTETRISL